MARNQKTNKGKAPAVDPTIAHDLPKFVGGVRIPSGRPFTETSTKHETYTPFDGGDSGYESRNTNTAILTFLRDNLPSLVVRVLSNVTTTVLIDVIRQEDIENMDIPNSNHQPVGPDAATLAAMAAFLTDQDENTDDDGNVSSASSDFPEFISVAHSEDVAGPSTAGPSTARTKVRRGNKHIKLHGSFFEKTATPVIKKRRLDGTLAKPIYVLSGDEGDAEDNDADMNL